MELSTYTCSRGTQFLFSLYIILNLFPFYRYLFSTEGHLLPATPQISLVHEHCSYFGAYCISNHSRQKSYTSDISMDSHETNSTRLCRGPVSSSFVLDSSSQKSTSVSGLIKVSMEYVGFGLVHFLYQMVIHMHPGMKAEGGRGLGRWWPPSTFGSSLVTPTIYVDVFYINGPQLFGFLFIISAQCSPLNFWFIILCFSPKHGMTLLVPLLCKSFSAIIRQFL